MSLDTLTPRQRAVFEFIRDKIAERGYAPSVRELCDEFNIKSPNGAVCHLRALEKKGLILRTANKSRAIQLVTGHENDEQGMPMLGVIAAGSLHQSIPQESRIDFNALFKVRSQFVLKIQGDSMCEAHIVDGDYVVVSPAKEAADGEIVVAQTPDGEATLKYLYKEKHRVRLQPANSSMEPIYLPDVKVLGIVVGVVRSL